MVVCWSKPKFRSLLWDSSGHWCKSSRWIMPRTFCPFPGLPCRAVIIIFERKKKKGKKIKRTHLSTFRSRLMLWPIAIHVCLTNREREKGIGPFSSCPSFPIPSFSQQEMKTMTNCLLFLMSVSFPLICYQELELMIAIEPFYTHSRLILRNQKQKKTLIVPPSS